MPRPGPAYPITKEWKGWVRDRIEELKRRGEIRSQNDLAAKAGIAKSSLSEALSEESVQSTVMPDIHRALGWPPPLMCPPVHILQLVEYYESLSPFEQGQQLEKLRAKMETERDSARLDKHSARNR